ncbi:hypothetical protein Cadr_000019755 [Camelus dromedarius]|uniref:Uncharacterized protein n=1 Tax=Camelus dromedarius TaxID=9838 RepID=A0A5N4D3J4_CAMDR|nr:hypothetical protein Cadr_000019755 [Camelus dromedarius]
MLGPCSQTPGTSSAFQGLASPVSGWAPGTVFETLPLPTRFHSQPPHDQVPLNGSQQHLHKAGPGNHLDYLQSPPQQDARRPLMVKSWSKAWVTSGEMPPTEGHFPKIKKWN